MWGRRGGGGSKRGGGLMAWGWGLAGFAGREEGEIRRAGLKGGVKRA